MNKQFLSFRMNKRFLSFRMNKRFLSFRMNKRFLSFRMNKRFSPVTRVCSLSFFFFPLSLTLARGRCAAGHCDKNHF